MPLKRGQHPSPCWSCPSGFGIIWVRRCSWRPLVVRECFLNRPHGVTFLPSDVAFRRDHGEYLVYTRLIVRVVTGNVQFLDRKPCWCCLFEP